jgi:signal transduction histidine kinase
VGREITKMGDLEMGDKTILAVGLMTLIVSIGFFILKIKKYRQSIVDISILLEKLISKEEYDRELLLLDTLESKLAHQVHRIINQMENERSEIERERDSIKTMISDISHQLKTPLANISLYAELIGDENITTEDREEFVDRIKLQSEKIDWLVKNLIKASRLESGMIELAAKKRKVKPLIASTIGMVYSDANAKNIDIEFAESGDIECVFDYKWTEEAIVNVLDNAVKYSPSNSKIKIEVVKLDIYTRINIIDQGIGIAKEDYNKIFKRFFRGENVRDKNGVGIGLYLTQNILNREGGYLTIESKENIGSCFSIFLRNETN